NTGQNCIKTPQRFSRRKDGEAKNATLELI
ncbi:unnamed protein product, partial [marine sediment metagenome]